MAPVDKYSRCCCFLLLLLLFFSRGVQCKPCSVSLVYQALAGLKRERANSPYLLKGALSWNWSSSNKYWTTTATVTKTSLKKQTVGLLQTLSRFFRFVQFKCWQIFVDLNSKKNYQGSGNEKESRCRVFTSFTEREIRHSRKCKEMYKKAWCTCKVVVLLI